MAQNVKQGGNKLKLNNDFIKIIFANYNTALIDPNKHYLICFGRHIKFLKWSVYIGYE